MPRVNLLCAYAGTADLGEFAQAFFKFADIKEGQKRESSNYVDSRYYRGYAYGAELTVSLADEEGNDDLPFWVQIATTSHHAADVLEGLVDCLVRERLLPAGFHVARMMNFGRQDEHRIDYI